MRWLILLLSLLVKVDNSKFLIDLLPKLHNVYLINQYKILVVIVHGLVKLDVVCFAFKLVSVEILEK